MKKILFIAAIAAPLMLGSCASKKAVADSTATSSSATVKPSSTHGSKHAKTGAEDGSALASLTFLRMVSDNQVYANDIVGNMSFNLKAGSKDITVPGSLHMRKDQVIRLQLFIPLLGTEVGRLEFTPDYVLVVDRLHKEYVKADYSQVDFLKVNGITFYSLQALFWNQLFVPGEKKVGESQLKRFDTSLGGSAPMVEVTQNSGRMQMTWTADRQTGRISEANITYRSQGSGESTLNWKYSSFKAVGVKQFPAQQVFKFATTATDKVPAVQVSIKMSDVKTSSNWDAQTELSSKYKKIEATDVLQKLLQL